MTNLNYKGRFDGIPRVVKRVPFYFVIAAASISTIAVIQYLAWEHMPIWNDAEASMPKHRMIDLTTSRDGRLVVAEYINISDQSNLPIGLSVSIVDTIDSTKRTVVCDPGVWEGALSPCGNWLATADTDGRVSLVTFGSSVSRSRSLLKLENGSKDLSWSNDSEILLVRSELSASLVNLQSEKVVATLPLGPSNRMVAPAGADCFLTCSKGKYCLFDWHTGKAVREVPIDINARLIALSADLRFTAYVVGSTLTLFDLQAEKELWSREYRFSWSVENPICFTPDDRGLAVVSIIGQSFDDYVIHVVDVESQRDVCIRLPENKVIAGFQFADEDSVWLWSTNGSINKWSLENPSQIRSTQDMPEFD